MKYFRSQNAMMHCIYRNKRPQMFTDYGTSMNRALFQNQSDCRRS